MKIRKKSQNALLDKLHGFQPVNRIGLLAADSQERIQKAKGTQKKSLKEIFVDQAHPTHPIDLSVEK